MSRTVRLRSGQWVPAIGQGTSHLGEGQRSLAEEEAALRLGIDLGMTVIDTAEIYAQGRSEELVARAIRGQRDAVFLVSKVWPGNEIVSACAKSLQRLGTEYLDLYLMHWPTDALDFTSTVDSFARLRTAGWIRAWGVSNFTVEHLERLFAVPGGDQCAANQILYNTANPNEQVITWCDKHDLPVMAYSPLGGPGSMLASTPDRIVQLLQWVIRSGKVIAIPKSGSVDHVRENARALA